MVRLHGVPVEIVSDRDNKFRLHESLNSRLSFSTSYHLEIDGQSKRMIQILKDILRTYIKKFGGVKGDFLDLSWQLKPWIK